MRNRSFLRAFLDSILALGGATIRRGRGSVTNLSCAAIFKQFENLRFRQLAESEGRTIDVVRFHPLILAGAMIACVACSLALPTVVTLPMLLYKMSFYDLNKDAEIMRWSVNSGAELGSLFAKSPWIVLLIDIGTVGAHFLFGIVCALLAPKRVAYSYSIAAALGVQLIPTLFSAFLWALARFQNHLPPPIVTVGDGIWSAAYVAAAFSGALVWGRRRERRVFDRVSR